MKGRLGYVGFAALYNFRFEQPMQVRLIPVGRGLFADSRPITTRPFAFVAEIGGPSGCII